MLDLCKMFEVEDKEEFKFTTLHRVYRVNNNTLEYKNCNNKWEESISTMNELSYRDVIKLPKRKEFTEDELNILKNIDKKYKYIARDKKYDNYNVKVGRLYVFGSYPTKSGDMWDVPFEYDNSEIPFNDMFKSIKWEDKEPICIDDYVTRN